MYEVIKGEVGSSGGDAGPVGEESEDAFGGGPEVTVECDAGVSVAFGEPVAVGPEYEWEVVVVGDIFEVEDSVELDLACG